MSTTPVPSRWYRLTLDRWVVGILMAEGILWLSARFRWFPFNQHAGWTVLITMTVTAAMMATMALWFVVALAFRRRFQFSLRSLLLLVLAVALPCSWLQVERLRAGRQHDAVAAFQRASGQGVIYDYQLDKPAKMTPKGPPFGDPRSRAFMEFQYSTGLIWHMSNPPVQPPATETLLRWLGHDFFCEVVVALPRDDAQLRPLRDLPTLRCVECPDTAVTDAGMATLDDLTRLQWLSLRRCKVTDGGASHLRGLSQMVFLDLGGTQVTDAGLVCVEGMPLLHTLDIGFTTIGEAGLSHLKGLRNLRQLNFWGNPITDKGLEQLRELDLKGLELGISKVTDAGLPQLAAMPHLRCLMLNGCKITDAGLPQLLRLSHLQFLDLHWTEVSDEGVKKLQKALPECKIDR